jgi:hypothetical protein
LLVGHSSYFPLYLYNKEFYNSFNVFKFFEKEVEKIWEIKVARRIRINPQSNQKIKKKQKRKNNKSTGETLLYKVATEIISICIFCGNFF